MTVPRYRPPSSSSSVIPTPCRRGLQRLSGKAGTVKMKSDGPGEVSGRETGERSWSMVKSLPAYSFRGGPGTLTGLTGSGIGFTGGGGAGLTVGGGGGTTGGGAAFAASTGGWCQAV